MPPNVTNRGARASNNWRQVYCDKKAYCASLDLIATCRRFATNSGIAYTIPPVPSAPFDRATIHSTMYLGNAMDDDNAMARHKHVLDWIRRAGYLVDDKKKHLRWLDLPQQVVKRGQTYRIELILTPELSGRPRCAVDVRPLNTP